MIRDYLTKKVWELTEEVVEDIGFDLVEIEFFRGPGRAILRFYIDSEGGITLDDCASVSRRLHTILEVEGIDDLIGGAYNLEVSSPGEKRPLRRPQDFIRFKGSKVRIISNTTVDGKKSFRGVLSDCDGDSIVVDGKKGSWNIPLEFIEKASLENALE